MRQKIKTIIVGNEVHVDFEGFAGNSCVGERNQLRIFLGLLGVGTEVAGRRDKGTVTEHVRQKRTIANR